MQQWCSWNTAGDMCVTPVPCGELWPAPRRTCWGRGWGRSSSSSAPGGRGRLYPPTSGKGPTWGQMCCKGGGGCRGGSYRDIYTTVHCNMWYFSVVLLLMMNFSVSCCGQCTRTKSKAYKTCPWFQKTPPLTLNQSPRNFYEQLGTLFTHYKEFFRSF